MGVEKQQIEPCLEQLIHSRLRKEYNRALCHHPVCLICWAHHEKCWAEWVTSWNQDRWEKHQQPQISGWYHSNGRKQRRTLKKKKTRLLMRVKEESERGSLRLNIQKSKIMVSGPIQFSSVTQSCPTVCDPMNRSTPGLPVHHQLPEFTQTHVHRVGDAIQPSPPLSSPSLPAHNPSQHQGLFSWVISSHQVAKGLEFQLQPQSFQWTPRTGLL